MATIPITGEREVFISHAGKDKFKWTKLTQAKELSGYAEELIVKEDGSYSGIIPTFDGKIIIESEVTASNETRESIKRMVAEDTLDRAVRVVRDMHNEYKGGKIIWYIPKNVYRELNRAAHLNYNMNFRRYLKSRRVRAQVKVVQ